MNRLTFVPSKINEIDIKEILPVLRQDPEFAREYDSIESARKEVMGKTNAASAKVQDLKQRLEHITAQAKEAHTEQKVYKTLKKLHESGKPAYSPIEQKHRAKRQRVAMTLNGSRHPLAGEDIQQKLDELDELREELDDECQRLAMKLEEACQEKKNGEQKIKACRGEAWFACVRRRNEQSIKDIQRDFVQVMRELNEDNSLDGTHGEPTEDVYDDEALAQMLPVKCVPARGYKKLTGGMQGQRVAAHFHNEAATGITALRDHAYQLAEDKMLAADEAFINEAKRLLNSLRLWCIGSSGTQGLAIAAIIDEPKYRKFVDNFIKLLFEITQKTMSHISDLIRTNVINSLPRGVLSGSEKAIPTSSKWTFHWKTFQAIMRRNGVFENKQRAYNFNEELSEPFMQAIDKHWTRTFNHAITRSAVAAAQDFTAAVASFGADFTKVFSETAATSDQVDSEAHLDGFIKSLDRILKTAVQTIAAEQRAANRLPEPLVRSNMEGTYQICYLESREGMLDRMKLHIRRHLEKNKTTMFREIENRLDTDLSNMMKRVKNTVLKQMSLSCTQFRQDCGHLISPRRHDFTHVDHAVRQEIVRVLQEAQLSFDSLTNLTAYDGLVLANAAPDPTLGPCLELVLANPRSGVVEEVVEDESESDSESFNGSGLG